MESLLRLASGITVRYSSSNQVKLSICHNQCLILNHEISFFALRHSRHNFDVAMLNPSTPVIDRIILMAPPFRFCLCIYDFYRPAIYLLNT